MKKTQSPATRADGGKFRVVLHWNRRAATWEWVKAERGWNGAKSGMTQRVAQRSRASKRAAEVRFRGDFPLAHLTKGQNVLAPC